MNTNPTTYEANNPRDLAVTYSNFAGSGKNYTQTGAFAGSVEKIVAVDAEHGYTVVKITDTKTGETLFTA